MLGTRDIIVLVLIIGSLPFCFLRPFYGIVLWTVIAFVNPQQLSWGAARTFPVALAVAIPTVAGALLFSKSWASLRSRDVVLVLVLWLWFTVTTVHTTLTPEFAEYEALTWIRLQFVSKILLMTLVTIGVVNTWSRLRWLVLCIAGSFGFFVLKAIPWMFATAGQYRLYGPGNSMIGDNNDFGLALNMTLPMFFFLARTEPSKRMKWLMVILFLVTIPAIFFTYSRGALVGLAIVLFLMVLRSRNKVLLIPVLVLAALFAVFLTPQKWQQRMDFADTDTLIDSSALSRINSWTYSWRLALAYPVTGGGFEAYTRTLFNRFAPNPLDVHGPHSIYFGVLAEHGFIGLFLYLALVFSCLRTLHQIAKYARFSGNEWAASYAAMLQLSLAGFLASGAFLGRAYFDFFFTVVACTVVLSRLCRVETPEIVLTEPIPQEQPA